jgi:holo-[acyl-carrier protein] synthase
VAAIGVDLVRVDRIRRMLDARNDAGMLQRLFTAAERRRARHDADPACSLAACFAAKEALLKALGCGLCRQVRLVEIEVVDEPGGPSLVFAGATARFVEACGGSDPALTITGDADHALALVML